MVGITDRTNVFLGISEEKVAAVIFCRMKCFLYNTAIKITWDFFPRL